MVISLNLLNKDLNKNMNNFSERYRKEKPKSREQTLLERLGELEQKNQELRIQLLEAITDPVTGLERRAGLFKQINYELAELLGQEGIKKLEGLEGLQLLEFLTELISSNKIKKLPLNIVMCDVAYLSLANKSGLKGGDELLRGIGDAAREVGSPEIKLEENMTAKEKKPLIKFYRHGGDEITAINREWPEEAETKMQEFARAVEEIKDIKDLEENNLLPHIDYGIAHIMEALIAFKIVMEGMESDFPPGSRLKTLENIWLEIAEMKSRINKTKDRILLLAKLRLNKPELYDKVIAYLRKGAQNISDKKLDELISQVKNNITGAKWGKIVSEFVIQELENENALNPRNQIILQAIQ